MEIRKKSGKDYGRTLPLLIIYIKYIMFNFVLQKHYHIFTK
nr:MAG TPA: hypothetical protein [Caudoviricetes sp.]